MIDFFLGDFVCIQGSVAVDSLPNPLLFAGFSTSRYVVIVNVCMYVNRDEENSMRSDIINSE